MLKSACSVCLGVGFLFFFLSGLWFSLVGWFGGSFAHLGSTKARPASGVLGGRRRSDEVAILAEWPQKVVFFWRGRRQLVLFDGKGSSESGDGCPRNPGGITPGEGGCGQSRALNGSVHEPLAV